jgi:type II secretory pathway pseudopilin PulG
MKASRGYTLVELLIASAVATTGLYASLNMVSYSTRGNTELRDVNAATGLAEHLIATMQAEGAMWVSDIPAETTPLFLKHLPMPPTAGLASDWQIAQFDTYSKDKRVGDLGNDGLVFDGGILQSIPSALSPRFCAHFRVIWVDESLVRGEVRVTWPRPHVNADQYIACPESMIYDVASVSTVTLMGTIMRNSSVN